MAKRRGKSRSSDGFYFLGLQNHCGGWLQPRNLKTLAPRRESYDRPRQHIKSRDITLLTKGRTVKAMVLPVVVHRRESWTTKTAENWRTDACWLWCYALESPLDSKETKPVNPKGNQSWIFSGRTDVEAEASMFWPLMWNHWKRLWCWKILKAKEEAGNRGWDG